MIWQVVGDLGDGGDGSPPAVSRGRAAGEGLGAKLPEADVYMCHFRVNILLKV